jgi:2-polyprenyl-3-methyl-5-hydroxy-6-metoxy-1,4-benzoquinol methylase
VGRRRGHALTTFHEAQPEVLRRMDAARNYNGWLLDRARPHLGARVLDLGAGIGTFSLALADLGKELVSVEPDPALAPLLRERLAERSGALVVEQPLEELRGETIGGNVDSVVCFNVLEHIAGDVEALRRMHGLLRPRGRLLLLVPAHPALTGAVDAAVGHERRYTRSSLAAAVGAAGLDVRELRHVNPVGALGWLVSSRLLRVDDVPTGPLALYDRLVPVIRPLDALRLPFGLSLWCVAQSG